MYVPFRRNWSSLYSAYAAYFSAEDAKALKVRQFLRVAPSHLRSDQRRADHNRLSFRKTKHSTSSSAENR